MIFGMGPAPRKRLLIAPQYWKRNRRAQAAISADIPSEVAVP
jgi:hypothetical protein